MKIGDTSSGSEGSQAATPTDLAYRAFNNPKFVFAWILSLLLILIFVSFPIQRVILIFWVYGREGFNHGIRVLPGKPIRFSDGVRVPRELDILTGFGVFWLTTFGLSLGLYLALRLYHHVFGQPQASDPR